jgi:hypothetical protein
MTQIPFVEIMSLFGSKGEKSVNEKGLMVEKSTNPMNGSMV